MLSANNTAAQMSCRVDRSSSTMNCLSHTSTDVRPVWFGDYELGYLGLLILGFKLEIWISLGIGADNLHTKTLGCQR